VQLHAVVIDELGMSIVEPAVLCRLIKQEGAGIRRRERNLDSMRIDLGRVTDSLFDRFLGLSWQAHDEGAVDHDAEVVAILGESAGDVDQDSLLDIVQDLLIP
jgi:hypothetical protein